MTLLPYTACYQASCAFKARNALRARGACILSFPILFPNETRSSHGYFEMWRYETGRTKACLARRASVALLALHADSACTARNASYRMGPRRMTQRKQPRKLALANQKGGAGKTATTLGLASAIAARGGDVLIIDIDQQGNATKGTGVTETDDLITTADLMSRAVTGALEGAIISTPWDGVDLVPSDINLGNIESDGSNDLVFRLDMAFEGVDLSAYDAVLFDCPPSLGKVLFSALIAADGVVAVTEPTIDSVEGVQNLITTLDGVRRRPNPRLVLDKIVIGRRRNTGEHIAREAELRDAYGDTVARTMIPELAARQDAHSERKKIHDFRGGKAVALRVAYDDLLDELGLVPSREDVKGA